MLAPDDRSTLLELLEPPFGFQLDAAVGLTYTLDLDALLTLPTAFATRGGAALDDAGADELTPLAVLDALRSYASRITICCDAAGIALPSSARMGVFAFLEKSIVPMRAPRGGAFHPKAWVIRFSDEGQCAVHRILVSSRNLTFDRSWDTVVRMDEDDGGVTLPGIARLLASCVSPSMLVGALNRQHRDRIESLAESVTRARFSPPPGFESVKVHPIGISQAAGSHMPFPKVVSRALIVSPFLTRAFLDRFPSDWDTTCLVSRGDELDRKVSERAPEITAPLTHANNGVPRSGFFYVTPSVVDGSGSDRSALTGLHAKLFVIDQPDGTSRVLTGSANATSAAFEANVEVLVEMVGPTRHVGVTAFVGADGLRPLLLTHAFGALLPQPNADPASDHLDALRRSGVCLAVLAEVAPAEGGRYDLRYRSIGTLPALGEARLEVRPLTVATWSAVSGVGELDHRVSVDEAGISGFLAVRLTEVAEERTMLLSTALTGAPEGRDERIIAALLADPVRLIRYLMMLLLDRPADRFDGAAQDAVDRSRHAGRATMNTIPLLEVMARALLGPRAKLVEVDRLLSELLPGSDLVDQDLSDLWRSMRSAAGLGGER